ncbi:MAG TPA: glycosyltransferase family 4 protein, partial [Pirellulaceae bacterium]|nr:glycosyltransferase family 4 protein [Pirellulaceae bacterium]
QWRFASRRHCDVIIQTWNARYVALWPGLARARFSRLGTILWGHGYSKRGNGVNHTVRAGLSRWATALLFYNYQTRERYIEQGFDPSRLFVALNTLDRSEMKAAQTYWQSNPDLLARWRNDQHIANRRVALYVSRLDPNNRLDWLIEALPQVVRQVPEALVVIVGGGESQYIESLRATAVRLGVSDSVRFVGPVYDERDLAPWFLSARLFCYPTNIGLSLIHSLIYGLPVITGRDRSRHNPEIEAFTAGVNGLDFADGDIAELAEQLVSCLSNDALRDRLAAGAAASVAERFTLSEMVDGMEAAIRYACPR